MNRGSRARKRQRARTRSSFNEAPIHESGKSKMCLKQRPSGLVASMRPRFMNRGSEIEPILGLEEAWLQ